MDEEPLPNKITFKSSTTPKKINKYRAAEIASLRTYMNHLRGPQITQFRTDALYEMLKSIMALLYIAFKNNVKHPNFLDENCWVVPPMRGPTKVC
jgi:hypothetical protein